MKVLVTLGPSSLNQEIIKALTKEGVYLFRINLSHTPLNELQNIITTIQSWTDVPLCLDTEGAQIRNHKMISDSVFYEVNNVVKIFHDKIIGDNSSISFKPIGVTKQLKIGDIIYLDFNSACFKIIETNKDYLLAEVKTGGIIGSNKAVNVDRPIKLESITDKDKEAIKISLKMQIKHFSLSFASSLKDINYMRKLIGNNSKLIAKIENIQGVLNLDEILSEANEILIDRGDLSREVPIQKIPFLQRKIISHAKSKGKPIFVATNLLESMVNSKNPTRAEVNDVASTYLMGADGYVLAAETAIGKYPVEAVVMINSLINQCKKWTKRSSLKDILYK